MDNLLPMRKPRLEMTQGQGIPRHKLHELVVERDAGSLVLSRDRTVLQVVLGRRSGRPGSSVTGPS